MSVSCFFTDISVVFKAKILYVDQQNYLIRIKENSRQFNVQIPMICGIMEST